MHLDLTVHALIEQEPHFVRVIEYLFLSMCHLLLAFTQRLIPNFTAYGTPGHGIEVIEERYFGTRHLNLLVVDNVEFEIFVLI